MSTDAAATVIDLWRFGTLSARLTRDIVAVEREVPSFAGQPLVAIAGVRRGSEDSEVRVRSQAGEWHAITAYPLVHPKHGAIPFERDGQLGIVWTSRHRRSGLFTVMVATTENRVGRVVRSNLAELDALKLALGVATGKVEVRR